jgi:hypothetical protein
MTRKRLNIFSFLFRTVSTIEIYHSEEGVPMSLSPFRKHLLSLCFAAVAAVAALAGLPDAIRLLAAGEERVPMSTNSMGSYLAAKAGPVVASNAPPAAFFAPFADDFGSSVGAPNLGSVTVGGSASGNIEAGGDRDWFAVTLVAGQSYIFNMDIGTLADPFLVLRDHNGVDIVGNDDIVTNVNFNSQFRFTATLSGTYYLDAFTSDGTGMGTYTVRAAIDPSPPPSNDDYGSQAGSPNVGTVAVGGSTTGNLETPGDRDWFAVTLTATGSYSFRQDAGTLVDPLLRLRDGNGILIASNDDGGGGLNSLINYTAVTTGIHYLEANTADAGSAAGTGTYTVSAAVNGNPPPPPVDDYGSQVGAGNLGSVAVGSTSTGLINFGGDHDWFAVTLSAGSIYRIRQEAGTLADPRFTLRNSIGAALVGDDDSGGGQNAQVDFTATTSGTYYIDANSADGTGTGTYTVRLTLLYGAPVIVNNTGSTVVEGAADTITSSELSTTDADSAASAIIYTVTGAPTNGTLTRNGTTVALNGTFTQADINSNLVVYTHNGSETTSASFGFSVSDGTTNITGRTFNFNVTPVNDAPTTTNLSGDAATYSQQQGLAALIDIGSNATVLDADSSNFDGGTLTVAITSGLVTAQDQLVIRVTGTVSFTPNAVFVNGTQIATYTGGGAGGGSLVFTFDPDASPANVAQLVRATAYNNTGGANPTAGERGITWTLVDGDGTANGGADTVTVTSTLNVVRPPAISKAFNPTNTVPNGISTLTLSITNPAGNAVALTGVGVVDNFPAGMEVDTAPAATNSCATGTFVPVAAATSITISGATIPVGTTCTFSVNVKATGNGALVNTTNAVTSTNGGTGNTATATLTTCLAPPANMKAWYTGDNTPRDIAGGFDGTIVDPDGALDPDYSAAKVGAGFDLDGANDYVDIGDVDLDATFTIDAWININATIPFAGQQTIISKDGAGARSYLFGVNPNGTLRGLVLGNGGASVTQYNSTTPIATSAFTHVAMTYNGSGAANQKIKFYVDGVLQGSTVAFAGQDAGGAPENTSLPARIGIYSDGSGAFRGKIDEVEIFSRELSQSEIQSIFNADAGGKCKPSDLRVTKTHTGDFEQGGTHSYVVTAINDGPAPTSGTTTMTDTLPAGLTPTGATGTGWLCNVMAPTVTCTSTDAIPAGGSFPPITLTVSVALNSPLSLTNTATVSGGGEMDVSDDSASDPTNVIPQTEVVIVGGNVTITDGLGGTSSDNIVISCTSAPDTVVISDPGTGLSQSILKSAITGSITINTLGGNDTLTIDLTGCNSIPPGGIFFNGGNPTVAPGDKLNIVGGNQGLVTYNYTNASDGSVVMSNYGTIHYTGLEPITNSGTAADVIFNLPVAASNAVLEDDGTAANSISRLRSANGTFETTDFTNPTGSITINRGNAADTLTVTALPDFNASLTIGTVGSRLSTITFNGNVSLASGKSFSGFASGAIGVVGNISTTGGGSIGLTSGTNLTVEAGINGIQATTGAVSLTAGQDLLLGTVLNFGDAVGRSVSLSANRDIIVANVTFVQADGAPGVSAMAGRNITIQGDSLVNANAGSAPVSLTSGNGGILTINNANGTSGSASNGGPITVTADDVVLTSGMISTTGNVFIRTVSAGRGMDLGTNTASTLGLTDAELDRVTAGRINIGDANSGTITTSADITRPAATNMNLVSAGDVLISGGQINTGGGTLLLDPGVSPFAVKPTKSSTDVTASTLSFGSDLAIEINGTTVDTQYTQLNVVGAVNLTGVSLVLSGSHVPTAGQQFVIVNNDLAEAIVGTFNGLPQSATISNFLGATGVNATISYTGGSGNDVVLTVDNIPPTVTSTTPLQGATGIDRNGNITLNFSEPVNIAAGGITVNCAGVQAFSPTLPQNGVTTIAIDPTSTLPAGVLCTVTGVSTGITDIPGNQLDGDNNGSAGPNFVLTFTTACTLNPVVQNSNNSGAGSLRNAVDDACPGSTITFNMGAGFVSSPISLSSSQIVLDKDLIIQGPGANLLTVQNAAAPSANSRVFQVNGGVTATISGLTISGGNPTDLGGGVYNIGTLTLAQASVTGNTAVRGGGIRNDGNLSIIESVISNNTSTFMGGGGGGIGNFGPALSVINSTITGNQVVSGNNNGGGIRSDNNSIVTITGSTITDNNAVGAASGGGLYRATGTVTVRDSIIAANRNNSTIPDVGGVFVSQGYNLIGNVGTATGFTGTADQVGGGVNPVIDPRLAPLANNGGRTQTHALCFAVGVPHPACTGLSPAIDKGFDFFGSGFDQRGNGPTFVRPFDLPDATFPDATGGDGSDIGAFESNNTPPSLTALPTTRQAGSPGANSQVAAAGDIETPIDDLSLTVNGGTAPVTVNGVTVTLTDSNAGSAGVNPTAAGAVFADVVAACGATTATFTLTVTDGGGLSTNATLTVTVTPNGAPVLTYTNPAAVVFGQSGITVNPATGPTDNGAVTTIQVQSTETFTGNVSVNAAGVVQISNAAPVGTHTITIRATDNCGAQTLATFQLTVNKANSQTTVQPVVNPSVYGDTVQLTASLTAVAPGSGTPQGTVSFLDGASPIAGCQNLNLNSFGSVTCTTTAPLPAGVRNITANYSGNANFNASSGTTTQTVNKKSLNITASSHTVTYGDAAPAVTSTITGFITGEGTGNLTTQPSCSTTYTQGSGVAGSPYPTSCSGAAAANYQFNYINGTVLVNKKALSLTAENKSRAYGAANPALTFTTSGFIAGDNLANSTTGSPGLSTTASTSSPVGTYPITITQGTLASANYSIGPLNNGTLTVTGVQLTVTAENKTRVFGAANPPLTFTVTGFVNGEGPGNLTGAPNLSTTANAASGPGTYPITVALGTLANPNYTFAFVNGTLTVTQAATTTTITNAASLAANTTTPGQSYAVNWSVSPVAPATGTPTGNVTVSDGTGATCSAAVAAGTCNLTSTTVGVKTITATYSGDANFTGSASAPVQHNVAIGITGNVKQFIAFGTNTNLAGVTLTLLNTGTNQATTTTTDANGNYSFGVITLGQSYTITPSGLGKAYEATTRTYSNVNTNISGADFLAYDVPGPNAIPRTARVVSQTATPGSPVTIPVLMTTTGVESSVAFTVQFAVGTLGIPTVACGTGAVGCNLSVDVFSPGKVGITIVPTAPLAAGTVQVARITFPTFPTNLTGTPVTFGDFPTARSVRNAENDPLPVLYWTDGQVAFTGGTLFEGASISGRVLTPNGQGLRNATVILIDPNGNRQTVTTGSFGNYQFENLELGRDYMVTVQSRRYRFAARTLNLTANLTGLDMIGLE